MEVLGIDSIVQLVLKTVMADTCHTVRRLLAEPQSDIYNRKPSETAYVAVRQ
jgi:hypothetical protein